MPGGQGHGSAAYGDVDQPAHLVASLLGSNDRQGSQEVQAVVNKKCSRSARLSRVPVLDRRGSARRYWSDDTLLPVVLLGVIAALTIAAVTIIGLYLPWWFDVLVCSLAACGCISLVLTRAVDPGVIQPCPVLDPVVIALEEGASGGSGYHYERDAIGQWRRRVVLPQNSSQNGTNVVGSGVGGVEVWERYCITCNIWRPPRVSHCRQCGYCMERFDHHCGMLGTCIARRNHRFFAAFLLLCQAACLTTVSGAAYLLIHMGFPTRPGIWQERITYIFLATGSVYLYTTLLLLFGTGHCINILCDVTTKDYLLYCSHPPLALNRLRERPLWQLVQAWRYICCAPVGLRCRVGRQWGQP